MSNEDRRALYRQVAAILEADGIDHLLIGGLAIDWLVGEAPLEPDGSAGESLLATDELATLVRVTEDADVLVLADVVLRAAARLRPIGLIDDARLRSNPLRLLGHGGMVDLIPCPPEPPTSTLAAHPDVGDVAAWLRPRLADHRTAGGVRIAHPAALVVFKALAWRQRHFERDATDIARVALWDASRQGATAATLAALAGDMPPGLLAPLRHVSAAFGGPDANGVSYFIKFARDALPEIRRDEELEDEVRRRIARSVQALLAPFR